MASPRLSWLIPVALALVLMTSALGRTDMWGSDEPRYAQAAREMMERGDLVHLTVNGREYTKKPPLLMWCQVMVATVSGRLDEFEARLPSALAGIGAVLLTFLIGCVLFDRATGLAGAAFLAVTPVFVKEARMARMDILVAFFVCLSFLGFAMWERRRGRGLLCFLLLFPPLLLGILTKWAAPLYVLPPVFLYLVLTRQMGRIPWLPCVVGLLLTVSPLLIWADLGEFGKVMGGAVHPRPPHYHLLRLPLVALPFVILVPGAIAYLRRRAVSQGDRRGLLLLASWILVDVAVLSLSRGKRSNYLDPLIPPAVLISGWFAARVLREAPSRLRRAFFSGPLAGFSVLAALAGAVLAVRPELALRRPEIPFSPTEVRICGALLALGSIGLLRLLRGDRQARSLVGIVSLLFVTSLLAFAVVNPARNPSQSVRPILDVYHERAGPDADLGYSGRDGGSGWPSAKWVFYARRRIEALFGTGETLDWLQGEGERFVIVRRRNYAPLVEAAGGALPARVRTEVDGRWKQTDFLLLSNRLGPGETVILGPD